MKTIDYVNLGIAVAGAVLALVAITWQAATWWLGGARVSVTMKEGVLGNGQLLTWPHGGAGRVNIGHPGFDQRVLVVEVTNKGRMHAYIATVRAELDNGIAFMPPSGPANQDLPYRLEPGATQSWVVDPSIIDIASTIPLADKLPSRRARMVVTTGTGRIHRTDYAPLD